MKTPKPPRTKKSGRRLSPREWTEAEELYRQGWTQRQIADKYGIRIETVSRHMTQYGVKGGEAAEAVREELANALKKKQRAFAEQKAARQIDAKEMLFKMNNALLAKYAREFQEMVGSGASLAALQGVAKALKDSVHALKISREEIYTILEIQENADATELPSLQVMSMTEEEENELRTRIAPDDEEEEEDDLAREMADVVERLEHELEATGAS